MPLRGGGGGTLAEDAEGSAATTTVQNSSFSGTVYYYEGTISAGGDYTVETLTLTYASSALVFCAAFSTCDSYATDVMKLRLFMNGVQMQESGYINSPISRVLRDFKVMSGSVACRLDIHNYSASAQNFYGNTRYAGSADVLPAGIACGSVKLG